MKSTNRRVSVLAIAVALSFTLAATAGPRDPGDRERPGKIFKIVKKIISVVTNDHMPIPPKP